LFKEKLLYVLLSVSIIAFYFVSFVSWKLEGVKIMDLIWCLVGQNFSCHFCDSKGRPQVSRLGFLEQLELTLKVRHPIWILYWKSFFSKAQEVCTGNLDQACRFGYMDLV